MTRPRRLCAVLAALLVAGGLSACGKHQSTGPVRIAETEGIYLDVSDLKYQVQVSRQFNPADVQDKAFLAGIPEDQRELKPDEVWFGVLLRVQNETDEDLLPSEDIEIEDTQEEIFKPLDARGRQPLRLPLGGRHPGRRDRSRSSTRRASTRRRAVRCCSSSSR